MSDMLSWRKILQTISRQKAFLAIIVILALMLFSKTNFYTSYNLLEMLNSASINAIIVAGVTFVIVASACDLSVGGMLSLSGIVTIMLLDNLTIVPAIVTALAIGAGIGFINGILVVRLRVEPFIITMGMGMLLKGLAQQLTDAHPISPSSPDFMLIANGKLFGTIPNLVIIMLVVLIIAYLILRFTAFGRNVYAVGGDLEVAKNSGINAIRTKWITYIISGAMAALAGILLSSRLNSGSSVYGDTTPLFVTCSAVIGGTSLAGGKGGIPQSFIGLIVLSILANSMNMLSVSSYIQQIAQGLVIVAILWFDHFTLKRKNEAV